VYSSYQLGKKFIKYYINASNSKGHGVHSPFVFEFIEKVLNDKTPYKVYGVIEAQRNLLLQNNTAIEVEDFGAGSATIKTNNRVVKAIASSSLKPKKYSQLLYRIISYYKKQSILELGTSLGITTAYLASAQNTSVNTLEGSVNIANIAKQNFSALQLNNINVIVGDFNETLLPLLNTNCIIDVAFIDGNHRKTPTVSYFEQLLSNINEHSILVFDDIHWSIEMEQAWDIIKNHPAVTLSIDLFFIGIVFFKTDFKVKQHFAIRF